MKSQTRASGSRATVIQRGVASRKSEQPDHVPTDVPSPSKATKEQEPSQSSTPPVPNSGKDLTTSLRGTTQVVGVRGADGSPSSGEVLVQSDHKVQAVAPSFCQPPLLSNNPFDHGQAPKLDTQPQPSVPFTQYCSCFDMLRRLFLTTAEVRLEASALNRQPIVMVAPGDTVFVSLRYFNYFLCNNGLGLPNKFSIDYVVRVKSKMGSW